MPIQITCPCGKQSLISDEYAGRRVRCPACRNPVDVPNHETIPEVAELVAEDGSRSSPAVDSIPRQVSENALPREVQGSWREHAKELFVYPQGLSRKAVKRALLKEGWGAEQARQVIRKVLGQWKAQAEALLRQGKRPSTVRRELIEEEGLPTREAKRIVRDLLRDLAKGDEQAKTGWDRFFSKMGMETRIGRKRFCHKCLLKKGPYSRNTADLKCRKCDIELCEECGVSKVASQRSRHCPRCQTTLNRIWGIGSLADTALTALFIIACILFLVNWRWFRGLSWDMVTWEIAAYASIIVVLIIYLLYRFFRSRSSNGIATT